MGWCCSVSSFEAVFLAINTIAMGMMGLDKARARAGRYRIPEKTLLLTAVLGGAAGICLGMYLFRHKTRHPLFYLGVPAILGLQVAVIVVL